jgi:hypothetical protein
MKNVLCILTIWNEIKFLPLKVKFCEENNLDLYIIDNMSDDGSWEWLQENNIPSHRFDTDGAFNLRLLQDEIVRTIHKLEPYWVIYNGCDLFPITDKTLYDSIMDIDKEGYNIASIDYIGFHNTGETNDNNFDPFNTYFYHGKSTVLNMIHKYHKDVVYNGDSVSIPNKRVKKLEGVMVNYGNTKPAEERNQTLERRKKAWLQGENRGHGVHYLMGKKNNWKRNKNDLYDVREGNYYKFIKKLQEINKLIINK